MHQQRVLAEQGKLPKQPDSTESVNLESPEASEACPTTPLRGPRDTSSPPPTQKKGDAPKTPARPAIKTDSGGETTPNQGVTATPRHTPVRDLDKCVLEHHFPTPGAATAVAPASEQHVAMQVVSGAEFGSSSSNRQADQDSRHYNGHPNKDTDDVGDLDHRGDLHVPGPAHVVSVSRGPRGSLNGTHVVPRCSPDSAARILDRSGLM